jgi:MoxR-like ATPase
VIRHRLLLAFAAEAEGRGADEVIAAVLRATSPPSA